MLLFQLRNIYTEKLLLQRRADGKMIEEGAPSEKEAQMPTTKISSLPITAEVWQNLRSYKVATYLNNFTGIFWQYVQLPDAGSYVRHFKWFLISEGPSRT